MSERLIAIIKELSNEESRLVDHRSKLNEQLQAIELRVKQIQEALSALGRKPSVKAKQKRTNSRPSKPAATKDDVIFALRTVLQADGELNQLKAKELVEAIIVSDGKSRTGFALRFNEASNSNSFVVHEGKLTLAEKSSSVTNPT